MEIRNKIVEMLIERLSIEIEDREHIDYDMNLFSNDDSEGYGLDSVDALEIIVGIRKLFGIEMKEEERKENVLYSINTLAEYIENKQAELTND